ncbi:hypothetical protein, partial [Deinococcus pimensis]|uniref:hypothetical protein n=1 Tax=Deinococcus pimensis TaxID=309888 RepID=UPI0004870259
MKAQSFPGPDPIVLGPTTELVGRTDVVHHLHHLITEGQARLVTVTGPGGVGKSTVAHAAARLAPSDLIHVDLTTVTTDAEARDLLLHAVGPAVPRDPRPLVLLADNAEHVRPGVRAAACVMRERPDVFLVVTSRRSLDLQDEVLVPVTPLALPSEGDPPAGILASPAVRLVLRHMDRRNLRLAEAVRSHPPLLADTARLCAHVDGLPLGLELVGAYSSVHGPSGLLRWLDRRAPLAFPRGHHTRQRDLDANVEWSYDLLPGDGKVWLRHVALLEGSFLVEDAARLGARLDLPGDALDVLTELVASSVVEVASEGASLSYRLLGTVRRFCLRELETLDEVAYARRALGLPPPRDAAEPAPR